MIADPFVSRPVSDCSAFLVIANCWNAQAITDIARVMSSDFGMLVGDVHCIRACDILPHCLTVLSQISPETCVFEDMTVRLPLSFKASVLKLLNYYQEQYKQGKGQSKKDLILSRKLGHEFIMETAQLLRDSPGIDKGLKLLCIKHGRLCHALSCFRTQCSKNTDGNINAMNMW